MTKIVSFYNGAADKVDITVTSYTYKCDRVIRVLPGNAGTNMYQNEPDQRYIEHWIITGEVSRADAETLRAYPKVAASAGYPKIRVYDKVAAAYYNDYEVRWESYTEEDMGGMQRYRVTIQVVK